ncbi:(2Fe-2S) ferredoxin domain-containing protein [Formosa sediminum]|uniref:(2Fe-2S) ferredoxin domain-containing protein n=1 Tax=Formosa sediminum TaxID=2594004 RepID=A0A516GSB6_9FLAO|nr:(2Fe-2S) ferredoxin domain-containing protein [Formosa sediminum]QDO94409.1 (2Fe-2S) ferredoxin domain-containing protein [Formosa sediminum]
MGKNIAKSKHTFFFCDGGSCQKAGSEQVVRTARAYLRNNDLWNTTHTIKTRCNGRCEDAPTCIVHPGEFWYKELSPEKITHIVKGHIYNDCPIETELLYKEGWKEQVSSKEKAPIKPKPFEFKADEELGDCLITRGFSSDQYLYPLFLLLLEKSEGVTLYKPNYNPIPFKEIKDVVYSKAYTLELLTNTDCIEFIIAAVPIDDMALQKSKISITEYYYQKETNKTGIRFKNKFGKTLGKIEFNALDNKAWKYCTKIQLQNLTLDVSQL